MLLGNWQVYRFREGFTRAEAAELQAEAVFKQRGAGPKTTGSPVRQSIVVYLYIYNRHICLCVYIYTERERDRACVEVYIYRLRMLHIP